MIGSLPPRYPTKTRAGLWYKVLKSAIYIPPSWPSTFEPRLLFSIP
ncbi:hypothetical protein CVT25_015698 [Psilocybe cyanescens]|uniref:Uncharacterized protein n=1 Tax=Psilocybe cyanescens TaxID=93625 RepID=A0A409WDQ5_PSICY|nr:hypothetical protein CVT25_015698 [Psilocybe cyanescens]